MITLATGLESMTLDVLFSTLGPMGIVLFFIWWSRERETRLMTRLDELEKFQKDTLTDLVRDAEKAISDGSNATRESTNAIHSLISTLAGRPCLVHNKEKGEHP